MTLGLVAEQLRPRERAGVLDQRIAADRALHDALEPFVMKAIELGFVAVLEIGCHAGLLPFGPARRGPWPPSPRPEGVRAWAASPRGRRRPRPDPYRRVATRGRPARATRRLRASSLARRLGGTSQGHASEPARSTSRTSSIRRATASIVSANSVTASSAPSSPHPARYGIVSPSTARPTLAAAR